MLRVEAVEEAHTEHRQIIIATLTREAVADGRRAGDSIETLSQRIQKGVVDQTGIHDSSESDNL